VGFVLPRAVLGRELARELAGALEQLAIGAEPCEAEIRQARLPRAEQLPLAAQLEIALRELEPVARLDERLEAGLRRVGQLFLRPGDQQAVRLLRPATHPAA